MTENQYVNRELSWLQFNARVLQEAADPSVPLIERLRFIGIFSNNLDEFFKVRYATVKRIDMAGKGGKSILGGIKAADLLEEITRIVIKQQAASLKILDEIREELEDYDVFIINEQEVKDSHRDFINTFFHQKVSPALVTIVLNDLAEIPHLKDSRAYLAVKMVMKKRRPKRNGQETESPEPGVKYALIEIPRSIERFVVLPSEGNKQYIIMLDDLIRYHLSSIFNIFDYESLTAHMIKITRDAELDIDNDLSKSFIEKISASVQGRVTGEPVRFVYDMNIEDDTLKYLMNKMDIDASDSIIPGGRYHNRRDYMNFPSMGKHELLHKPVHPLPLPQLDMQDSIFEHISQRDYLLHAPYQTFSYMIKFLREAALDPKVKSIKITIYRLAKISHIASSLINAVKNGKQVLVQIELRARFDEVANIHYAEQMQQAGVQLIFGVKGLKVHAKCCVIEREERGRRTKYGFISTGNLNETTANIYTDYTLFTHRQNILKEIDMVFDFFEVNYKVNKYQHLIVSPHYTRKTLIKLVDTEIANAKAGKPAGIRLKLNSLSDYPMIDKLYEASKAGVKMRLIVRGICSLIPGVEGMSENIEVISIVDKYLEHSRVYIFENAGDPKVYISSADWMPRNLDARVEVACPIYDESIKKEIMDVFEISWSDNVKARIISQAQDNAYRKTKGVPVRSQIAIAQYYADKMKKTEKA